MRLLLDTHTLIWWTIKHRRLGKKALQSISKATDVYISIASAWEFAVKTARGKFVADVDFQDAVREFDFKLLPISFEHVRGLAHLPLPPGDPFDRMLAAQARSENLILVTADGKLLQSAIQTMDATK